jgi:pimeloyl-ACP methyl ester carboxylesterase
MRTESPTKPIHASDGRGTHGKSNKRTITLKRPYGPLVADIWDTLTPTDVPPLLLIHGWGGTGNYLHGIAAKLSATMTVIVPDLPGTGRSQPVRSARGMQDQVASIADLLRELGITQLQVMGHSMGGAIALLLADQHPDWIERIALTSVSFFATDAQVQVYKAVAHGLRATMSLRGKWMASVPGMPQMMARTFFYRVPNDQALLRRGLQDYLELDAGTAIASAFDVPSAAIPQAGTRIRVPTLLIACRQDQVMPVDNVEYTARLIPNCTVQWIEQCGHLPMLEKPQEYMAILSSFLRLS